MTGSASRRFPLGRVVHPARDDVPGAPLGSVVSSVHLGMTWTCMTVCPAAYPQSMPTLNPSGGVVVAERM